MDDLLCRVGLQSRYLLGMGLLLGYANTVYAYDYTVGFNIPYSIVYDSNIQLLEDEKSVVLHSLIPTVTLKANDELNQFTLGAGLRVQRSSDKQISEDREDPNMSLGWIREFTNGQFNADMAYSKVSTRVSELRNSGVVAADGSSINRSVNLGASYFLTDRYTLSGGVGYQEQDISGTGLSDFNNKNINAKLSYFYSEQLTPFIQYSISKYEDVTLNRSSVSNQYSAGAIAQLTPKLSLTSFLGVNHIGGESSGWIGSANIDYLLDDKSTLTSTLSRSVTASGIGGFLKSDSFSASYAYQVNQFDRLGADVGWNINRALNDNRFKQFNVWYSRDLAEAWVARTFIQYRTLTGLVVDADAYQVGLSINYSIPNF